MRVFEVFHLDGHPVDFLEQCFQRFVHAALDGGGICARGDVLDARSHESSQEDNAGGGAIARFFFDFSGDQVPATNGAQRSLRTGSPVFG